jgi:hypothetical protein
VNRAFTKLVSTLAAILALSYALVARAQDAQPGRARGSSAAPRPGGPDEAYSSPNRTSVAAPTIVDYTDPTYGGKIRQLRKDDGHEHNFYYYRDPWNADGSLLLGIQSDLQQKNWHVVLYDGDGQFRKDLFAIDQFDWRLCWDGKDPDILYTWRDSELYRFHVAAGQAELMKSFKPLALMTNGPSVNQAGDRVLVATSDKRFHSLRLPDLGDERTFKPEIPEGTRMGWDKPRFTGYQNTIDVAFHSDDLKTQGILVYDDTGTLIHRFDGFGGGGHYAFAPDGRLAYFFMPNYPRTDGKDSLDIHVVKLDGTDDRVVFSAPRAQTRFVQNLHLSWPAHVSGWCLASFYHFPGAQPPAYAPLYDEILQITTDGSSKYLARTGGNYSRGAGRGSSTDMFWAMPLAAPSADGRRISFNTNRSGTVDQCILFLGPS